MPNHSSKPTRPKLPADANQRGKAIVDFLTRDRDADPAPVQVEAVANAPAPEIEPPSDALRLAAAELGRRGRVEGRQGEGREPHA